MKMQSSMFGPVLPYIYLTVAICGAQGMSQFYELTYNLQGLGGRKGPKGFPGPLVGQILSC